MSQQGIERDTSFHPGESCTHAIMATFAKRKVPVGLSLKIDGVGRVELPVVTIGGCDSAEHNVAPRNAGAS
jgi:hypothetical protein